MLEVAIDVIKKEFESVPDSEQLTEKVVAKLRQTYDSPPVKDFELIVNKPFTADEVRTALFAPLENQIPYYSILLLAAIEAPIGHPLSKTGSLLLTLMYLIHRKHHSFLKEFVLSEGLIPLTKMMRNDNLYERSQALEIFMSITDCDVYDWFQPPAGHADKLLHQKLLDLINHPHFLQNLLLNRTDSYPGGSFRALQILAFWLSWVRALYTKDQKLSLSRALMDDLHQWSSQLPNPDAGIMEEEVQLAKTLMDDFCKDYPQGSPDGTSPAAGGLSVTGVMLPLEHLTDKSTTPVIDAEVDEVTVPTPQKSPVERIQELKEDGNVRYRAGDVDTALEKYEEALQLAGSLQGSDISTNKQHELMVTLYTNLSNALWKKYTVAKDMKRDADVCQPLLAKITEQCELALTLHPTHTKAFYRLITTMIEQHQHKEAYDRAEQFKTILLQTKTSSPQDVESNGVGFSQQVTDDIDRISRLQRKCTAVELLQCHERGTPFGNSSQWGMDKKRLKLLSTILKRDHLHHILPTVIVDEPSPPSQDASQPSNTASSSSSSSAAVAAAKKAKEEIFKADPKVDKILSYLFEQRDESVDRDVTSRVTSKKKEATKKDTTTKSSSSGVASKKKSSSSSTAAEVDGNATKPKITASDRKLVQQIKRMASTFSTLMLRAKSYSTEDPTIIGEKTKLLTDALEHLTTLLQQKQFAFRDLFLTLDDNDVLFLVSIVTHALQSPTTHEVAQQLIGGIVGADRIQSLFFLFRMEYPQVREIAASTLQSHVDTLTTAGIAKALAAYTKLLNE